MSLANVSSCQTSSTWFASTGSVISRVDAFSSWKPCASITPLTALRTLANRSSALAPGKSERCPRTVTLHARAVLQRDRHARIHQVHAHALGDADLAAVRAIDLEAGIDHRLLQALQL